MAEVDFKTWKKFIAGQKNVHVLQTAEWGELKRGFGWGVARLICGKVGVQILFRKLPLGFTVAYLPKPMKQDDGPLTVDGEERSTVYRLRSEIDAVCRKKHAIFLKVEPDNWEDQPSTFHLQPATISPHNIQPPRTVVI
jgi:peptidoglycan pentaglycine glycine transferase (the first glycine)